MKIKNSIIFILLTLTAFLYSKIISAETTTILNEVLQQYNLIFNKIGTLPVMRDFKYPAREKVLHTIIAQEDKIRIEIEIIKPMSNEEAKNYSESKYKIIKNLYGPQIIPYSGTFTNETECPEDKKPEEITLNMLGEDRKVLLANASERYVLGVWDDNIIKTKAAFSMVYDKRNLTMYQIIIFQPYSEFEKKQIFGILENISVLEND